MDLCCPVYCAGLKLSRGGKVANGKGDLPKGKVKRCPSLTTGWELLGRVEVEVEGLGTIGQG